MGNRISRKGRQQWLTFTIFTVVVLAGLGIVAYGLFGGKPAVAPMPETFFSAQDHDTYVAKKNDFVLSDGPVVAVPSLEMQSELISTGAKDGYLVLPKPPRATWYEKTAKLGADEGRTLIASHVDSGLGSAAPFSRLHKIEKGAPIQVRGDDGILREYKAKSIKLYERQELPNDLFRTTGDHELVLVTCSGPTIDAGEAAYYMYNLVVIAEPIDD